MHVEKKNKTKKKRNTKNYCNKFRTLFGVVHYISANKLISFTNNINNARTQCVI